MKVLCIIPCYNAQDTLRGAIDSIINQSYTNWELIIVDDASTDKSYKIAQSYSKQYSNITVLKNNTNQGCYYSRNRALYHMKDKEWDVFTIHDADDTSTHDRFKIYTDLFLNDLKISVIIGIYNGKRWKWNREIPKIEYSPSGEATGTSWYKKDIFNTFGYFDDTRYSGDSEYTERIQEYLLRITPDNIGSKQFRDQIMKKLRSEYSYTYTTGFHSGGNLTQNYKKPERIKYRTQYKKNHQTWNNPQDFYINFKPLKQDI